jgi:CRISPR type III-A-associated protein Csm2
MYRNNNNYGREWNGDRRGGREPHNSGTSVEVPDPIKKYINLENLTDEQQYDIFKLEGLIKKTYCSSQADETKMNQLRKFYDNILSISDTYDSSNENSDGRLIRLVPIAKYAEARGLINHELLKLIDTGVNLVSVEKDKERKKNILLRFRYVMEAVIAYSKKEKGGK